MVLIPDAVYASDTIHVEPGERVIVYTDGVTEAEDPAGEFFGDSGLNLLFDRAVAFRIFFSRCSALWIPHPRATIAPCLRSATEVVSDTLPEQPAADSSSTPGTHEISGMRDP